MPGVFNCLLSAKCDSAFSSVSLAVVRNAVAQEAVGDGLGPFIPSFWRHATETPPIYLMCELRTDGTAGSAGSPAFVLSAADVIQSTVGPMVEAPPLVSSDAGWW